MKITCSLRILCLNKIINTVQNNAPKYNTAAEWHNSRWKQLARPFNRFPDTQLHHHQHHYHHHQSHVPITLFFFCLLFIKPPMQQVSRNLLMPLGYTNYNRLPHDMYTVYMIERRSSNCGPQYILVLFQLTRVEQDVLDGQIWPSNFEHLHHQINSLEWCFRLFNNAVSAWCIT